MPKTHEETVKKEVAQLVQRGILRRINRSQWASPTFIVPKKLNEGQTTDATREKMPGTNLRPFGSSTPTHAALRHEAPISSHNPNYGSDTCRQASLGAIEIPSQNTSPFFLCAFARSVASIDAIGVLTATKNEIISALVIMLEVNLNIDFSSCLNTFNLRSVSPATARRRIYLRAREKEHKIISLTRTHSLNEIRS